MSSKTAYQATAIAHAIVALAHTAKSKDFLSDPQFKRLPRLVAAYPRAGWFQGSVWFFIGALLNYRWSRVSGPLTDPVERAIAVLITAVYLGTAAWYTKEGDAATGGILTVVGGMQTWSAFFSNI